MNNLVKNVFLLMMGLVAAFLVYFMLFGNRSLDGHNIYMGSANLHWKGALWYAAEQLENPISRYYYEYCYLPNIHTNDYLDEALGGTRNTGGLYYHGSMQETRTDLSGSDDLYTFHSTGDITHYSTGWR